MMFYLGKIIFSILRGKLRRQLGMSSRQGKYLIRKRVEPFTTHSFILILIIVWKHGAIHILLILIHYLSSKIRNWESSLVPLSVPHLAPLYSNLKLLPDVYYSNLSVQILMFLGEIPDNLIYYVCLRENSVLEEELCHSVACVTTTVCWFFQN